MLVKALDIGRTTHRNNLSTQNCLTTVLSRQCLIFDLLIFFLRRNKMDTFKLQTTLKVGVGPGGRKCPCCIPFPLRELKVYERRVARRSLQQELRQMLRDPENYE